MAAVPDQPLTVEDLDRCVAEATKELEEGVRGNPMVFSSRVVAALHEVAQGLERDLRREWWFNHGHSGLYGDDGEMGCGTCGADFKRWPIERLRRVVLESRLERGMAAAREAGLLPAEDAPRDGGGE